MSKQTLLEQYRKDVETVRNSAKELGLSEKSVNRLLKESFDDADNDETKCSNAKAQKFQFAIKLFLFFVLLALCLYILLNVHQPTSSIVLRNVQGLIYPGLKIVRRLFVPIITLFPSLTDLYDESCLLENPFFQVSDMECWPCEDVYSVIDLTNIKDQTSLQSGVPFITKTNQPQVNFTTLKDYYIKNQPILGTDVRRFTSTSTNYATLDNFLQINPDEFKSSNLHISWRINKMNPARIIRKLFPRPDFISKWSGQSVERFVMLDGAKAEPYVLPNTECSYVFVIQGSGERNIVLKPSKECSKECRTVSVHLKQADVLWYNWWYWRPISLPVVNFTEASVSYINSYC